MSDSEAKFSEEVKKLAKRHSIEAFVILFGSDNPDVFHGHAVGLEEDKVPVVLIEAAQGLIHALNARDNS